MKVYIIIQTEEYESGYIIHGVYTSKIIAIEKVESIIEEKKKEGLWGDERWFFSSTDGSWENQSGDTVEILEEELQD